MPFPGRVVRSNARSTTLAMDILSQQTVNGLQRSSTCVLKVTAVLAKVAIKAASGLDLPVSDFINGAKFNLVEEVAHRVLENAVVWAPSEN